MTATINELFSAATRRGGDSTAYIHRAPDGSWKHTTFSEAARRVESIGAGLLELGVSVGDRVAILSNSRIEWSLCDYAILGTGAVVTPIYQTNSPQECQYVLNDAAAVAVVVEDAVQAAKIAEVRDSLPNLKHVIAIDMDGIDDATITSLAAIEQQGSQASPKTWHDAASAVSTDDLATLIYTSGTTGPPKGCMLSHGNYASMSGMIAEPAVHLFDNTDRVVLFLPLAHTFARLIHFVTMQLNAELAFTLPPTLMDDLAEIKPTILPSVPRIFEKAYTRIAGMLAQATGMKARLIAWAMRTGRLRGRYVEAGRRVPPLLALQFAIASKLVFSKIHARFGGNLRLCVSGGAPLGSEVQEFFLAAGILILEGYGLTESTTAVTVNRPDAFRVGSVGPALPHTELRIAKEDGEILARGPQVFLGYYNNEAATAEVLTPDGWLRTGDVGMLEDGFLRITDRKKDLIITAGGKNISPQNIENGLKATQYVSQALVFGDKRPYLTALITLDEEELSIFAATKGLPTAMAQLIATPDVQTLVRTAVDQVNAEVGRVEQVKRYRILPIDFTQESGELTPSLKLKRKVVCERYMPIIEAMYDSDAPECDIVTEPTLMASRETVTA